MSGSEPAIALDGFFAALLWVAAAGKARAPRRWFEVARRVFTQPRAARAFAFTVPAAEAAAGTLLVVAPIVGAPLAALLMIGFATGSCALRGRLAGVSCGCFGGLSRSTFGRSLCVRNIALAACASALPFAASAPATGWSWRAWPEVGLVLAAAGGVLVAGRMLSGRTRLPQDLRGKRWLGVFVAADCPACRRMFDALVREAARSGPAIVVIPLGGAAPPELDALVRLELAPLARAWDVRGTPFAVLVSPAGRVVASGPATTSVELTRLRSGAAGPPLTRREAVDAGLRAVVALAGLPALVLASTRAALAAGANDVTIARRRLNRIEGNCSKLDDRACHQGVVISDNPVKFDKSSSGCEYGATKGPDNVSVELCDYEYYNAGFVWSGYCPCDTAKTLYTSESECKEDCQGHGLKCFGQQCQTTRKEYCAKARFTICVKVSGWTVNPLEWAPKSSTCAASADRVNRMILAHELAHVSDDRDVANKLREKHDLKQCAKTQRDALAALARQMEETRAARERALIAKFNSDKLLQQAKRDADNRRIECHAGGC